MAERTLVRLDDRALLSVSGADRSEFLQGLITNDVDKVAPDRAIYAALLTPQGKYLHDFFVLERDDAFLLDCEAARMADLERRLKMYRLRAKVTIEPLKDALVVAALLGDDAAAGVGLAAEPGAAAARDGGVVWVDPRLVALGVRAALPEGALAALAAAGFAAAGRDAYDALRLAHGVPDGSRDLVAEGPFALECGFDGLHGVDFEKGCYVGQEVTARMKHRDLVRKLVIPVTIDGPAPAPGAPVLRGDVEAGEMRSAAGGRGLALLRLEHVEAAARDNVALTADGATLTPHMPEWAAG